MRNSYQEANLSGADAVAENGRWLIGVSAIVADNRDPERQHRVRVIIPTIDEDMIFDEWARQLVFCLGNRRGAAFIPPKGAEVILFGQLGQKYNLFYASVYNEEMFVPDGYDDENTVGIHAPGKLILKADGEAKLKGATAIVEATTAATLKSGAQTKIEGAIVTVNANGSVSITGGAVSISSGGIVQIAGGTVKIFDRTVNPVGPPI